MLGFPKKNIRKKRKQSKNTCLHAYIQYIHTHVHKTENNSQKRKTTFQFIKIARRDRTINSTAMRLLMFWRKERTKESNRGLPSAFGDEGSWFSIMRSKAKEENAETTAFRTWANASYAASQISAAVYSDQFKSISESILLKLTNSNGN